MKTNRSLSSLLHLCAALYAVALSQPVSAATLRGRVTDSSDGEPLPFATLSVTPSATMVRTDVDGCFAVVLPEGSYSLTATYVGYTPATLSVVLNSDRSVDLRLGRASKTLGEVTVTATESGGMTSSSRIGRDAMEHLQPTSFTDLLELLPGNVSHTPAMGSVNLITLRETGQKSATGADISGDDYAISSLGTLFMIDGAPVNGDANLQSEGIAPDASSPASRRISTNRGVDMRTISTDGIESVEIVRGIPSAEYGNLTSGLVNIRRLRRPTPLTARFKADEYGKLLAVGKGLTIPGHAHVVNAELGWLDSKVDPRDNLENYQRLTASLRGNLRFERAVAVTTWLIGGDYTASIDNSKVDPDLNYNKIDEFRSSYRRASLTSDLTVDLAGSPLVDMLGLNTSVSYQADMLERRRQVAPPRASVAPTTMTPGVHPGEYLLGEYIADYQSDGRPLNTFVKLRAAGSRTLGRVGLRYKAGGEWTMSKNYGRGQIYDLRRPLSASWTSRPRAYRDIPALNVLSLFAETEASVAAGGFDMKLQAGLRSIQLPGLSTAYSLSGKVYADPRVNAMITLPEISAGASPLVVTLAGGFGLTTKMPTVDYLYPQPHYTDIIQLNYYDVAEPRQRSLISLRTYIDDAVNYDLRPARNSKWEIRTGAEWRGNRLSVTYFREQMTDGFRYSAIYAPYAFKAYDASAIDPAALDGQPYLSALPYTDRVVLDGYRKATNGTRILKEGVEFQLTTARWRPLCTSLTVSGAWFRTTYSNSQMLYSTVSDVVGGEAVSDRYVGLYDYLDGRVNEQVNTNFMFDTQIPRWGLVFTTSLQCMWWVKTTRLPQNGVPPLYLDAADGQLHPYTAASMEDTALQFLIKDYNADAYRTQTVPFAGYLNLKATKRIGRYLKLALFVNRIVDWLPDYESNGITVRRSSDCYFGMEANLTI